MPRLLVNLHLQPTAAHILLQHSTRSTTHAHMQPAATSKQLMLTLRGHRPSTITHADPRGGHHRPPRHLHRAGKHTSTGGQCLPCTAHSLPTCPAACPACVASRPQLAGPARRLLLRCNAGKTHGSAAPSAHSLPLPFPVAACCHALLPVLPACACRTAHLPHTITAPYRSTRRRWEQRATSWRAYCRHQPAPSQSKTSHFQRWVSWWVLRPKLVGNGQSNFRSASK